MTRWRCVRATIGRVRAARATADGRHTVAITIADRVDNRSAPTRLPVWIDGTAPDVTLTESRGTITATTTDTLSGPTTTIIRVVDQTGTTIRTGNGTTRATVTTNDLPPGRYRIVADATDTATNPARTRAEIVKTDERVPAVVLVPITAPISPPVSSRSPAPPTARYASLFPSLSDFAYLCAGGAAPNVAGGPYGIASGCVSGILRGGALITGAKVGRVLAGDLAEALRGDRDDVRRAEQNFAGLLARATARWNDEVVAYPGLYRADDVRAMGGFLRKGYSAFFDCIRAQELQKPECDANDLNLLAYFPRAAIEIPLRLRSGLNRPEEFIHRIYEGVHKDETDREIDGTPEIFANTARWLFKSPQYRHLHFPAKSMRKENRRDGPCGGGIAGQENRLGRRPNPKNGDPYQCDEFPYASTVESGIAKKDGYAAWVLRSEQLIQGSALGRLANQVRNAGGSKFHVLLVPAPGPRGPQ